MTTQDFLDALESHADHPLVFQGDAFTVPGGYHVTEIKATRVHAMDCGGRAAQWDETILQLSAPARDGGEPMTAGKFLGIQRRVGDQLPLTPTATVRAEYGAPGATAVSYLVTGIDAQPNRVVVRLAAPAVACKPNDPSVDDLPMVPASSASAIGGCC